SAARFLYHGHGQIQRTRLCRGSDESGAHHTLQHQPNHRDLSHAKRLFDPSLVHRRRVTIHQRRCFLSHVSPCETPGRNQGAFGAKEFRLSYFWRIAEERILEAQRAGAFAHLPGKGKPLQLEDLNWVPEDLRIGYMVLKNAHVLPPEAELLKVIHTLEDLLKHVEDDGARRALAKSIQWKMIRLDMLKRRTMTVNTVRDYSRKLISKFQAG